MTDLGGTQSRAPVFKIVLAGEPVLSHHVELLALMLDDHPIAERLKRGLSQRNSIVALTTEDREHLIRVLATPPSGLAALQRVLQRQQETLRRREPDAPSRHSS